MQLTELKRKSGNKKQGIDPLINIQIMGVNTGEERKMNDRVKNVRNR